MTRHLGYQHMPERQTLWRSIVDFWRTCLIVILGMFVIVLATAAQVVIMLVAYYLGSLIHPWVGFLFAAIATFFSLPLLFGGVVSLIEEADL